MTLTGLLWHQITAYAGEKGDAPFQQAFPQSPGFDPSESNLDHEELYNALLRKGNATSLADPRAASSTNLIAANQALLFNNTYGSGRESKRCGCTVYSCVR